MKFTSTIDSNLIADWRPAVLVDGFPCFLSQAEAADTLGVSIKTIYRMRLRGELGFIKAPGGRIVIPREAVEFWLDSHYFPPMGVMDLAPSHANWESDSRSPLFEPAPTSLRDLDAVLDMSEADQ